MVLAEDEEIARATSGTQPNTDNDQNDTKTPSDENTFGISDQAFEDMIAQEISQDPVAAEYPEIFAAAPACVRKWRQRYRGDPTVWKRLFHKDRVLKEFIEAAPAMDAVRRFVCSSTVDEKFTVLDLASGKGFLSMFLSELLPPSKIKRFVLMDKAWSMHGMEPQPHHMSWDHIYGISKQTPSDHDETGSTVKKYTELYPIPLTTSKQDLKAGKQVRNLQDRFLRNQGPVILLAIHLCGTLSLQAVRLFNDNPDVRFFCLKPCCLPGTIHARRHEVFRLGTYAFDAKCVCVHGKWNRDRWMGPHRSRLRPIFDVWSHHLYCGIAATDDENNMAAAVSKKHLYVPVQHDGGYQNDFLMAERGQPATPAVWDDLAKRVDKTSLAAVNG